MEDCGLLRIVEGNFVGGTLCGGTDSGRDVLCRGRFVGGQIV